jgi:hypothetical protein
MRSAISFFWAFLFVFPLFAQNPVKWSFSTKDAGNGQVDLILTGVIEEGWSTYSQFLESEDGPVATTLAFKESAHYKLVGKAAEGGDKITVHDKVFDMQTHRRARQLYGLQRRNVPAAQRRRF